MFLPFSSFCVSALALSIMTFPHVAFSSPIVAYPPGTLLENIAISSSGDLFVTAIDSGSIFRVSPAGTSQLFGAVPGPATGAAFNTDGNLIVASGTSLFRLASDGAASQVADIPGAIFLNGIALFSTDMILAADDTASTIWMVNLLTGSSQVWSNDPILLPGPDGPPFSPNGIKLFQGSVYVSNTGAGTIIRIPILSNGLAGAPVVFLSSLFGDDFAFAADGTLFVATQTGEIIRIAPNGTRTSLATNTFGDAAVAFGRTAADHQSIYIVNNGGAFLDLPGGPEAASITRLAVGINGVVPENQAIPEPSSFALSCVGTVALLFFFQNRRSGIDSTRDFPRNI